MDVTKESCPYAASKWEEGCVRQHFQFNDKLSMSPTIMADSIGRMELLVGQNDQDQTETLFRLTFKAINNYRQANSYVVIYSQGCYAELPDNVKIKCLTSTYCNDKLTAGLITPEEENGI